MNQNLSIGLLLSAADFELVPAWLKNHDGIGKEIIIGVDGTPDELYFALSNFHTNQSDCDIIHTPLNNDFAGARNLIIENCKTDWILFLDADELLMPNQDRFLLKSNIWNNTSQPKHYSAARYNLFNRHWISSPECHSCLMTKDSRYQNLSPYAGARPGCHEKPSSNYGGMLPNLQILHLKENWTGNFRAKGYGDSRQQEALADLHKKIEETKQP